MPAEGLDERSGVVDPRMLHESDPHRGGIGLVDAGEGLGDAIGLDELHTPQYAAAPSGWWARSTLRAGVAGVQNAERSLTSQRSPTFRMVASTRFWSIAGAFWAAVVVAWLMKASTRTVDPPAPSPVESMTPAS